MQLTHGYCVVRKNLWIRAVTVLFALLFVPFVATHAGGKERVSELKIVSRKEAKKRLKLFDYKESDFSFKKREVIKTADNYDLEEIEMVIHDPLDRYGSYDQEFIYYNVQSGHKNPVVIVSRPLKNRFVDRFVARSFAKLGYSSLLIVPPESLIDPDLAFDMYNEILIRYTITMRMTVDMLETFPEVDAQRIYAYGLSMGGIRTILGFIADKRIKKAAVIVGGGDLPGVLTDSRYPVVMHALRSRMRVEGVNSIEELKEMLYQKMTIDPLHFGFVRDPEDVLFVLGKNDQFVRDKYQQRLYETYSRPKEGRFPGYIQSAFGHVFTVYSLRNHAADFVNFIETGATEDPPDFDWN